METHYSDNEPPKDLDSLHAAPTIDHSGLKLYYTSALRKHDAGVLSIGELMPPSTDITSVNRSFALPFTRYACVCV